MRITWGIWKACISMGSPTILRDGCLPALVTLSFGLLFASTFVHLPPSLVVLPSPLKYYASLCSSPLALSYGSLSPSSLSRFARSSGFRISDT